MTVPLTAAVLLLWSTWYLFLDHQRDSMGPRDGRSRLEAFEMHVLKALGFDRMRQKPNSFSGNNTMEVMTDDMA